MAKDEIKQLTFTRFIAARSVFLVHYGAAGSLLEKNVLLGIFGELNYAVTYFFVLSGFLLFINYNGKISFSFGHFYLNRVARIYPVYLLAWLAISLPLFFYPKYYGFYEDFFSGLLMIQSWWRDRALTLNFPAWSLSVEAFFYICFPFFIMFMQGKSLLRLVLWVGAIWLVSQVAYVFLLHDTYRAHLPLTHVSSFIVGMLSGLIYLETKKRFTVKCAGFFSLAAILALVGLNQLESLRYVGHSGLYAPVMGAFLIFFSISDNAVTRFLGQPLFVLLGNISYSIYIFQVPLEIYFYKLFNKSLVSTSKEYAALYFVFLVLFSIFMYLYLEKPLNLRIKKMFVKAKEA